MSPEVFNEYLKRIQKGKDIRLKLAAVDKNNKIVLWQLCTFEIEGEKALNKYGLPIPFRVSEEAKLEKLDRDGE